MSQGFWTFKSPVFFCCTFSAQLSQMRAVDLIFFFEREKSMKSSLHLKRQQFLTYIYIYIFIYIHIYTVFSRRVPSKLPPKTSWQAYLLCCFFCFKFFFRPPTKKEQVGGRNSSSYFRVRPKLIANNAMATWIAGGHYLVEQWIKGPWLFWVYK